MTSPLTTRLHAHSLRKGTSPRLRSKPPPFVYSSTLLHSSVVVFLPSLALSEACDMLQNNRRNRNCRSRPAFSSGVCGKLYLWPARNLCFAVTWPFGRMRVARGRRRCLHQQATIIATNAAAGMTSLCPKPSEWTGTVLAAHVYLGLVGISLLKRSVQP